ncbi:MAG: hypothetical protein JNL10_22410 [Verrucomicrobiales bacterium]|nr:hypothetical protein [Verrucomicrobiales bacterium]
MSSSVNQHPILWLIAAFLAGMMVEWILEIFYFRQRLFDSEARARRRGEELDSERFHHGRTQAELKTRTGELDTAQKGRTLAESLLTAARGKLAVAEAELVAAAAERTRLEGEVSRQQREITSLRDDVTRGHEAVVDSGLRCSLLEAEALNGQTALSETRRQLSATDSQLAQALSRVSALEASSADVARQLSQHKIDLHTLQTERDSRTRELEKARESLEAARRNGEEADRRRTALGEERDALAARVEKLESAAVASRNAATAQEQKLKARSEELKQVSLQLGEAAEELAGLKSRCAQVEANLEAAARTRSTLEAELAGRDRDLSALRSEAADRASAAADASALAELREELETVRRDVASWRSRTEELEAELLSTSESHRELARENERLRSTTPSGAADDSLEAELTAMTRERNELAAELAVLRAERNP